MIKKMRVDQLRPGMFVQDFNCEWLNHPFVRNSLKIKSEGVISDIIELGIHEVYIDTKADILTA